MNKELCPNLIKSYQIYFKNTRYLHKKLSFKISIIKELQCKLAPLSLRIIQPGNFHKFHLSNKAFLSSLSRQ